MKIAKEQTRYTLKGHVTLQEPTSAAKQIKMIVRACSARRTLSTARVDEKGDFIVSFESRVPLQSPVELVVGPAGPMGGLSRINTKKIEIKPDQWKPTGSFSISDVLVGVEPWVWTCWKTRDIVIRGIVCKEVPIPGTTLTRCCPVPYAEVEVFDVDPQSWIAKVEAKKVLPEAVVEKKYMMTKQAWPPIPPPPPEISAVVHEPVRLRRKMLVRKTRAGLYSENPGPIAIGLQAEAASGVITTKTIGVFQPTYSTQSLGKTSTDLCGEFEITIKWPDCPSITDDESPDLIFKVTQTVGPSTSPTTTTLYSEGHHATRWDVPNYVYVELDAAEDAFVACNPDCAPFAERRVYFQGVGEQVIEEHVIQPGDAQGRPTGYVYNGSFVKSPFGEMIKVRAKFGTKIEETGERYYRIFYAPAPPSGGEPAPSDWTAITEGLTDTYFYSETVSGVGLVINYRQVALGPLSIGGSPAEYYEIRNLKDNAGHDLGWLDENKAAIFDTTKVPDGLYVLKIEVVMPDKTADPAVHYGDDLGKKARIYLMVNNKKPHAEIKQVLNGGDEIDKECGSFIHELGEAVQFLVDAYHEDNHLLYWKMTYQIGYGSAKGTIKEDLSGYTTGDFHGKENENVDWDYFDKDFNWVPEDQASETAPPRPSPPPKPDHECTTYGVSVELEVMDKTTNGEDFLGSGYGHYIQKHAGLAVSRPAT